jgi:hypothetical protein
VGFAGVGLFLGAGAAGRSPPSEPLSMHVFAPLAWSSQAVELALNSAQPRKAEQCSQHPANEVVFAVIENLVGSQIRAVAGCGAGDYHSQPHSFRGVQC